MSESDKEVKETETETEKEVPLESSVKSIGENKPTGVTLFHRTIEHWFEKLVRYTFFWETDDVKIGRFLRFIHHSIVYSFGILYILNHTIVPSYFLFLILYGILTLVWIQHLVCGGCLSSKLEQKLIGDTKSFVDPIMDIFHIPITHDSTIGVVILGSSLTMLMLTMELLNRTILNIQSWIILAAARQQ